jgi:hypothetical protein
MNQKTVIHLAMIVVVYAIFFGLIYMMTTAWLQALNVTPKEGEGADYRAAFQKWALVVMVVSLVATIVWYALAEWSFRVAVPVAQSKRWIWFLGLAVVVLGSFAAEFFGPKASLNGHVPTLFYFVGGAGFYYLATALFSPVSYKYTPPGASSLRFI